MDSENPALYGQYLKVTTPLISPTVGQNPPGTPLVLFAGPGYIEVSEGEPTIFHLTPISSDLNPIFEKSTVCKIRKN